MGRYGGYGGQGGYGSSNKVGGYGGHGGYGGTGGYGSTSSSHIHKHKHSHSIRPTHSHHHHHSSHYDYVPNVTVGGYGGHVEFFATIFVYIVLIIVLALFNHYEDHVEFDRKGKFFPFRNNNLEDNFQRFNKFGHNLRLEQVQDSILRAIEITTQKYNTNKSLI